MTPTKELLRKATTTLLDAGRLAYSLKQEVTELMSILEAAQTVELEKHLDMAEGDTRTNDGLALSPESAAMCAEDFARTVVFLRGTYSAVLDVRERFPDRPAHVLYAGCGPYGTLVTPLMSVFSETEAVFTLLDIHADSIESVKSVISSLGVSALVASFNVVDAGSYEINPDDLPDVILTEVMQACLEVEPQVAVSRHLVEQAPNAILIPESVSVDLMMADPAKEFELGSMGSDAAIVVRDRIPVGLAFELNQDSIQSWQGISGDSLPGGQMRIPDVDMGRYQPMLFTGIRVYQQHTLSDYDSGLTCPRILLTENAIKPGDEIQFRYELGSHPRLICC